MPEDLQNEHTGPGAGASTPETEPLARPSTLLGPRAKLFAALGLAAAALIYFSVTAFQGATVEFMKVKEVAGLGPTPDGRTVGVLGKLVEDSFVRSADGVTANFQLKDEDGNGSTLPVVYSGEVGQVFFNDHSEIILQGAVEPDGVFAARTLTVRCPSKYLTEQERAEIEAQNNGDPLPPPYQPDYFESGPST